MKILCIQQDMINGYVKNHKKFFKWLKFRKIGARLFFFLVRQFHVIQPIKQFCVFFEKMYISV